jgi:hypothetical protein
MTTMEEFFGEPISVYTRAQAIADGVLVDVTEAAKQAGFRIPVALTAALWGTCQAEATEPDSVSERVRDVLWAARCRVAAALKNRRFGIDGDEAVPLAFSACIWRRSYRAWIVFNPAEGFTIGFPEDF